MAEFRLVEFLNSKLFYSYEKSFPMEAFSTLDVYKNILVEKRKISYFGLALNLFRHLISTNQDD